MSAIDLDAVIAECRYEMEHPGLIRGRLAAVPVLLAEVERLNQVVADEIAEKNDVVDGYRDHAYAMVERAKAAEAEVERLDDENRSLRDQLGHVKATADALVRLAMVDEPADSHQQPATADLSHEDGESKAEDGHADDAGNASAFRSWHWGDRDQKCVEAWPECSPDAYDPRCCRFPKPCSCRPIIEGDE